MTYTGGPAHGGAWKDLPDPSTPVPAAWYTQADTTFADLDNVRVPNLESAAAALPFTSANTDVSSASVGGLYALGVPSTGNFNLSTIDPTPVVPTDIGAQPLNAALTSVAGLTPSNDDVLQRKSGAWTNRTLAQLATDLAGTALVRVTATTQASSYTLVLADAGTAIESTSASAVNHTVPPNSSVAFPVGTVIELCQYGAGQITVVAGAGVTLRNPSSLTSRAQYSTISLRKRGTDEWVVAGDVT